MIAKPTHRLLAASCFILGLLFLSSCAKKRIEENPEFIGQWVHETSTSIAVLDIDDDGSVEYRKSTYSTSGRSSVQSETNVSGKFKVKDDQLRITFLFRFDIDEYPAADTVPGARFMVLNGDRFQTFD